LKRALRVLGEPDDRTAADPIRVTLQGRVLSVADAHDGAAAARFVSLLRDAGASDAAEGRDPDLRIVIRSTPQSAEARLRSEVMEEGADLVLGSARGSFAQRLARRLAE
jgi:phosphomannomutase